MTVETYAPLMALRLANEDADIDLDILQGLWSEEQYLKLTDQTNRLIEFTDGNMEVLSMPIPKHQKILGYLYRSLFALLEASGGIVLFSPLRVRVRPHKYREPDLVVLLDANDPRQQERYWMGADLVIEIVSDDDPERDTKVKRVDYAGAHIPEYWIVNPLDETITVLTLDGDAYAEHGVFRRTETATSLLIDGFAVSVDSVLDAR